MTVTEEPVEVEEEQIPLSPAEQVVNRLHDILIGKGMDAGEAAATLRADLARRAPAVQLDEGFWAWLGS